MNNDEIRELIKAKGITVDNVTQDQLNDLLKRLSKKLRDSGCFNGTFRMKSRKGSRYMTCKSYYFDGREAVSFNSDGFIGMAGWAGSKNIQPIRDAVIEWAESNTSKQ